MKTTTMISSISRPVTELEYSPTGISDGVHGELYAAPAYGDLAHGPHGTFIKMPAGYVSPTHTRRSSGSDCGREGDHALVEVTRVPRIVCPVFAKFMRSSNIRNHSFFE